MSHTSFYIVYLFVLWKLLHKVHQEICLGLVGLCIAEGGLGRVYRVDAPLQHYSYDQSPWQKFSRAKLGGAKTLKHFNFNNKINVTWVNVVSILQACSLQSIVLLAINWTVMMSGAYTDPSETDYIKVRWSGVRFLL